MTISSRFEILEKIGEGGMGEVHMALDLMTGEVVAVKIASVNQSKDPKGLKARFLREIEILSKLQNPHIVRFIDSGSDDDTLYYAMEFIPGQPITRTGDYLKSAKLILQVAQALEEIHRIGIIHRDLKPTNILVCEGSAKLLDFGIAHMSDSNSAMLTKAGTFIGTAEYMSPEQLMCSGLDERSDIYALGAVLYEVLVGKPPFAAEEIVSLIYKVIQERPANLIEIDNTIPPMLESICMKMLEKRPERRYQTVKELIADLTSFVDGLTPTQKLSFSYVSMESPYIGRTDIFANFNEMLTNVISGSGMSMQIFGGNGFGKTRTLAELQSIALSRYVRFVACDGNVCQPGFPAISTLLDSLADYDFNYDPDFVKAHAQLIRSISPKLADKLNLPEDSPSQNEDEQAPYVIADLLINAFKDTPVVYAFDGCFDSFTKKVIETLVASCSSSKTNIVATGPQKQPFEFSLSVELKPFDKDELSALAERILGRKISFDELNSLSDRTSGNPQFAFELIRESRNLRKTITLTSLPESLAELMSSRLRVLDGKPLELLCKMALLNHPVSIDELQRIANFDDASFALSLKSLFEENLITERLAGAEFVIELSSGALMEVVIATIDAKERCRLNEELANAMEGIDRNKFSFVIGLHYLKAGLVDKGVGFITDAFANADTTQQYKKSEYYTLEVLPFVEKVSDSQVRNRCYYYCIRSYIQNGKLSLADELLEKYRKSVWESKSTNEEKIGFYVCELAMLLGAKNYEKQIKVAFEAMKLINISTSMNSRALLNYYLGSGYIHLTQPDKGIPLVQKSIEQTNRLVDKFLAINVLAIGYSKLGKYDEAIKCLETVRIESKEKNLIHQELVAIFNMTSFYTNTGRPQIAVDMIKYVLEGAKSHHFDILTANSYMKAIVLNNAMHKIKDNKQLIENCIEFFDRKGLKTNIVQIYQQAAILSFLEKNELMFNQQLSRLKKEAIALKIRSYIVVCGIIKSEEIIERKSWQELMDYISEAENELQTLMPNQTKDDMLVLKFACFALAYANMGMVEKAKNQLRQAQHILEKEKKECDLSWVEIVFQLAKCEVGMFDSFQGQTIKGSFFSRTIDENPKRLIPETWESIYKLIEDTYKTFVKTPFIDYYYKPRMSLIHAKHILNKLKLEPNCQNKQEIANKAIMSLSDVLGYLNDNDLLAYKEEIRQTNRAITDIMIRKRY